MKAIRLAARSDGAASRTLARRCLLDRSQSDRRPRDARPTPLVVITPSAINKLGVAMTVPVTTGGAAGRATGMTVLIQGHDTTGVAVCNQVRAFDIQARVAAGSAHYIETLDPATSEEIVSRVLSIIDPA